MNASEKIDQYIEKTRGWKGETIEKLRKIVHEVEPKITEEWKWNSPILSYNGMVCGIGAFKTHVKINFLMGAHLKDNTAFLRVDWTPKTHAQLILKKVTRLMRRC